MKAPSSQPAHQLASTGTPEPVDGFAYFMVPDGSDAFSFTGNGISHDSEGTFGPVDGSVDLAGGSTLHDASQFGPDAQVSGDLFDHMPAAGMPFDPAAPSGAQPGIVIALNSNPGDVSDGGVLSVNDTPIFGSLFPGHSATDLFSALTDPITGDLPDQSAVGSPATNPTTANLTSQSTAWSAATSAELNSSTSFSSGPGTLANQPSCAPNYLGFDAPLHVGSTQSQTVPSGLSSFGQPSNGLTTGAAPDLFGPVPSNNSSGPALSAADAPDFLDVVGGSAAQAASAASGSSGTAAASGSSQIVTLAGSGLVFDNTFDSGVSATFQSEIVAAENYLQSQFSNTCTVNVTFDLESINPNYSGENFFDPTVVSYSAFVNALEAHAATATEEAAVVALSNLPDPSHGAGFEVSIGEARILGLAGAGSGTDDTVILNSVYWTASALQSDPGDVEAVLEHELSEGIMGRIGSLGIADAPYWAPMDLFRYTASGQRDFTGGQDGQPTYFSVNGSNVYTGLQYHNSVNSSGQFDGFDFADWDQVGADANAHDPFGPGGPGAGDPGTLSATDIAIMEALGWNPSTTYVWGTGTNGSFATAANWNPGIVPTSGIDTVLIGTGNYTVTSSVSETVNSLSTAAGTTFNITGGTFTVDNGTGTGTNAGTIDVESGATLVVHGTMSNSGTIKILGGNEFDYGATNGTTINSGGYEYVAAGGTANTTTVQSGGLLDDYGTTSGTIVHSGGYEYVRAGGTANTTTVQGDLLDYGAVSGTTINNGGAQFEEAGATATGTTINSGGYEYVAAGGNANTTTVQSGGLLDDYGTTSGTIIHSGGYEYVRAGGTANATTAQGDLVDYGTASGTTINNGGAQFEEAGATATGTLINSGGYEYVAAGGTANTTTVQSGGFLDDYGTTSGTIIHSGGYEYVRAGGTANTTTVQGDLVDYGTVSGTTINNGGALFEEAGATATGMTINSGGYEYVAAGGTANTMTVQSGGFLDDYGTTSGTTIDSGGYEYVRAGGTTNTTTVQGDLVDYGTVNGTTINNGGAQFEEAGATATGTTINSGGYEILLAGGTSSGTTIAGGTVIVESGGTASGTFTFSSSGLLVLNDLNYSSLQLAGFTASTDKIDFTGISFSGSTHFTFNTTTDLLTVTDGTHTATITIDGAQHSFTMSSDGSGGTIVTDPLLIADTSLGAAQHTQQSFTTSSDGSGGTIATNLPPSVDTGVGSFGNTSGLPTIMDGAHTPTNTVDGQHTQQSFTMSSDGSDSTNVTDPLLSADGSVGSFSSGAAIPAPTPVETPVASSRSPADHGAAATAGLAALGNPQNDTFVFNTNLGSNSMATPQSPLGSETMSHFATLDPTQASHGGSPTGAPSFGPAAMAEHVSSDFGPHDANSGAIVPLPESHPVDLYAHPPLIG